MIPTSMSEDFLLEEGVIYHLAILDLSLKTSDALFLRL